MITTSRIILLTLLYSILLTLLYSLWTHLWAEEPIQSKETYNLDRIVSVGGHVTEVVFALGVGPQVVGVDGSSVYPPETTRLPKVGYHRSVSVEGVLSLSPTLLIAGDDIGPPAAIKQLQEAGLPLLIIPSNYSIDGAKEKIRTIARAITQVHKGEQLIKNMEKDFQQIQQLTVHVKQKPKVLFIYARGHSTLLVSGQSTGPNTMLKLAHARNAVTHFTSFKPLTPEAVISAAPDIILMLERGYQSIGEEKGVLALPGIALTPAGKQRRIVTMEDLYLLSFGPRLGKAVRDLILRLHPEINRNMREP